jgi:hypothetical protein
MVSRVVCIARELLLSNSPYFIPFFWEEARFRRECEPAQRSRNLSNCDNSKNFYVGLHRVTSAIWQGWHSSPVTVGKHNPGLFLFWEIWM